jgi:hypothetical protein
MKSIATYRVNDVISLQYGDRVNERICRVLKVRNLNKEPLSIKTLIRHPNTIRNNVLVTYKDTEGKIRSFYTGVEKSARKVNPLRVAILCLRGKLPCRVRR